MNRPKVIVESFIPYMEGLAEVADVKVLSPEEITPESVADMDALMVRTRTRCNYDLLGKSKVKFVGTATIGLDHIDQKWCAGNGIFATNAPGCNAPAVAQYVFCSLMQLINRPLKRYVIGIVGVGHVGRIVEQWARSMDMKVMLCDPPRQRAEGGDGWSTLNEIAEKADIITFHTPLTRSGEDATYHLADAAFFNSLRRSPIVINAARGPVADTQAWIDAIKCGQVGASVVDCWEGEPALNKELLLLADIATPHIAGYSRQGKIRASQTVVDAFTDFFGLPSVKVVKEEVPLTAKSITPTVALQRYNPLEDTDVLRLMPDEFERLRNEYELREELPERYES